MGLVDLRDKKKSLSKFAYVSRVQAFMNTAAAQKVAASYAKRFRKTCKEVVERKGAASDA